MRITIEFPTNKYSEIEYIDKILFEQDHMDVFTVIAVVDGDIGHSIIDKSRNRISGKVFIVHADDSIVKYNSHLGPAISMTALRLCATGFSLKMGSDYGIMTDGDVTYSSEAIDFILNTIGRFPKACEEDNYALFCNMRGFFGSAGPSDNVLIPRQLPLGTNNGTIYNQEAMRRLIYHSPPLLPGGCEDPMISSWMFLKNIAIPLRRFKSPMRHPRKNEDHYSKSLIHNKDIMERNNFRVIKEIWGEVIAEKPGHIWAGIPDNKEQSGKSIDGKILLAHHPRSEEVVKARFNSTHAHWDELKEYVNWKV